MTERLHPDGMPLSATPECDTYRRMGESHNPFVLERRAREAEARVAELEAYIERCYQDQVMAEPPLLAASEDAKE